MNNLDHRIVNSALWSAYGDALGFITELADDRTLAYRITEKKVTFLTPWKRRVGGVSGAIIEFPSGVYSDDTQLRLSTSRCINASGYFDVESFAKIELPVWLSYCLGAGRGTKLAASNLIKSDTNWFSNFYEGKTGSYFSSGGNGVLMRVQPHVWGAVNGSEDGILLDVVRNSVCTHGHLRAIIGACFHAILLKRSLKLKVIPSINDWLMVAYGLKNLKKIIEDDIQLSSFWIPAWEHATKESFDEAINKVVDEVVSDIEKIIKIESSDLSNYDKYQSALNDLGAFDPASRGSGTKTAILSSYLALLFFSDPEEGIILSVNQLGSDTDTIATAAGAVIGAVSDSKPNGKILDQKYIEKEALRISGLNNGNAENEFKYPDLYKWKTPRKLVDGFCRSSDQFYILGLGRARVVGKKEEVGKNKNLRWNWVQTAFGQTFLIRSRDVIHEIGSSSNVFESLGEGYVESVASSSSKLSYENLSLGFNEVEEIEKFENFNSGNKNLHDHAKNGSCKGIDDLVLQAEQSAFKNETVGCIVNDLIDRGRPTEEIVAFVAMLVCKKRVRE